MYSSIDEEDEFSMAEKFRATEGEIKPRFPKPEEFDLEEDDFANAEQFRGTEGDINRAKYKGLKIDDEGMYQSPGKEGQNQEKEKVMLHVKGKNEANAGESGQAEAETNAESGKFNSPKEDKSKYTAENFSKRAKFISNRDDERNKNSKRLIYSLKSLELQATTFVTPFAKNQQELEKEMERVQELEKKGSENEIAHRIAKEATEILQRFPKQIKVIPAARSKTTRGGRKSMPLMKSPEESLNMFYSNDPELNQQISNLQKLVASKPKKQIPTVSFAKQESYQKYLVPEGVVAFNPGQNSSGKKTFNSFCYSEKSNEAIKGDSDEDVGYFCPSADEEEEEEENKENDLERKEKQGSDEGSEEMEFNQKEFLSKISQEKVQNACPIKTMLSKEDNDAPEEEESKSNEEDSSSNEDSFSSNEDSLSSNEEGSCKNSEEEDN